METFNERLKGLRQMKDWSKAATAKKLHISTQRYANWEYGARQPDYDMLVSIAKVFDTTTDFLTGKTDNPVPPTKAEIKSSDLDKILSSARSFDGKPMSNHDRDIIRGYLQGYFQTK